MERLLKELFWGAVIFIGIHIGFFMLIASFKK